jgi:hypothetical protein
VVPDGSAVACVAAIFFSAVRTSCTVRSRSGIVPMTASSDRGESRLTSTVLAAPRQALVQPVGHSLLDRVRRRRPNTRV